MQCRRILNTVFAVVISLVGLLGSAQAQEFAGCGGKTVEIADLQWPSASVLAHIHRIILADELNCETTVVVTDIESVTTTLKATQRPTLIPEIWPTRVADRWNQMMESRAALLGGPTFDQSIFEAWFVPSQVVLDFPSLKNAESLKELGALYGLSEKPKFISCPKGWACALINRNLLRALGLADKFEIVEPENRVAMDQLIGQLSASQTPSVFYYWQPNGLLDELALQKIDLGAFDAEAFECLGSSSCTSPKPSSFPLEQVNLVAADWVRGGAPELLPYVRKAQMPMQIMNQLLAKMVAANLSSEEVAAHFVADYREIWQEWLPRFDQ